MAETINVARPFLPPFEDFLPLLRDMWDRRALTNGGPYHCRLEQQLSQRFGGADVSLVANGMLGLSLALEAAQLTGEVITTPYSFVATTHAIAKAGLTPVFADILDDRLTIDPAAIEAAITPRTSAILAVHVYGTPCNVEALAEIAQRHGLILIYDAAHAFGVELDGRSVLAWGDYSVLSFHATKSFNTFEGGAVVSNRADKAVIDRLRNFGIDDDTTISAIGGNAKMNEFSAALGLLQLEHISAVRAQLAQVDDTYRALLGGIPGLRLLLPVGGSAPNFSYFPVLVEPAFRTSRDGLFAELRERGINARRYFFPLLANLPMYCNLMSAAPANLPVANRIAGQILCLPIYAGLGDEDLQKIANVIRGMAAAG